MARSPYIQVPVDLFTRPGWPLLLRCYPRALEWWLHLVLIARQARSEDGALTAGGKPLNVEDLAFAWNRHLDPDEVEEFESYITTATNHGLLREEGGTFYVVGIADWWTPAPPSDSPDAERERWQRRKESGWTRNKQPAPDLHRTTPESHRKHRTDSERDIDIDHEPPPPPPTEGSEDGRASAHEEDEVSSTDWGTFRPRNGASPLEALRPVVGEALQQLGLLAAPSGPWWTQFAAAAAPALEAGADVEDVRGALVYAVAAAKHSRPESPWPWALTTMGRAVGAVRKRNALRRAWEAGGRKGAEPLPYVFTPRTGARGPPPG